MQKKRPFREPVFCDQVVKFTVVHMSLHNDTELALGMTLLELHYVLQVFCVRQEDGGGVNRRS